MERMIQYKEELGQSRRFKEENTDYTYTQMHTHTQHWSIYSPQDDCIREKGLTVGVYGYGVGGIGGFSCPALRMMAKTILFFILPVYGRSFACLRGAGRNQL